MDRLYGDLRESLTDVGHVRLVLGTNTDEGGKWKEVRQQLQRTGFYYTYGILDTTYARALDSTVQTTPYIPSWSDRVTAAVTQSPRNETFR